MDDFKTMAEVKMRESIEAKVQGEIDADEARLAEQQQEFENLQTQDSRVEKRQSWLQAISGQGTQTQQPQMGVDPSALGARPSALGASAGRAPRGALAQAAAQHQPSMGLAGMRAPRSAAKSLSGAQPVARPVKAPIGGATPLAGRPAATLPQPIQPKVVRQPIVKSPTQLTQNEPSQPVPSPVVASPVVAPSLVKSPTIKPPSISQPKQTVAPEIEELKPEIATVEEIVEQEEPVTVEEISEIVEDEIASEVEEIEPAVEVEPIVEEIIDEIPKLEPKLATLTPLKKLEPVQAEEVVVLKPVTMKVLEPVKRRGPPPSSAPGKRPGSSKVVNPTATLTPITKLTPIESKSESETED